MKKEQNHLDRKIKKYLDQLFAGVEESRELHEQKEELAINLKEKIADYQAQGMDEATSFKEAIISMGDLSSLVEDLRKVGEKTKQPSNPSPMTTYISTAGIVVGVLMSLFGVFTIAMLSFTDLKMGNPAGPGIFIVLGISILTYSILTRGTSRRPGMKQSRAVLYALSAGLILFSLYSAIITNLQTGELNISIASMMVFFLAGIGLWLTLFLTGSDRRKRGYQE
jgi:hypothetical protein